MTATSTRPWRGTVPGTSPGRSSRTHTHSREPDLTLYFDVPVDVSFDRRQGPTEPEVLRGRVGHGLDNRPIRVLQDLPAGCPRSTRDWWKRAGSNARCRGNRGGGPVRGEETFDKHIDLSEVQVIDQSDRLAQNLSESDIDWLTYSEGDGE